MDTKIKVPPAPKVEVMLWTDVAYHDMEEIDNTQSIPDLESVLCRVLRIDLAEPKRGVLLELYVQTVLFCREHGFKKEQTSALLSIIKSIHEANIETPLNNIEQCFKYSKELLLSHSVRRPPFSINLFSFKEADCILKYIQNNYIRHYKLYKYIFTPQFKLDLTLTYTGTQEHEESSAPDVMEDKAEVISKKDDSPKAQETSNADQEESTLGQTSTLKAMIEKEIREQMILISGKLDERMKEKADEYIKILDSQQSTHKAKK